MVKDSRKKEEVTMHTRRRKNRHVNFHPPDLVSLVLVANGKQVQQNFIEVAKGKVYAHHCNCIAWGHLRARDRRRKITRSRNR